MRREGHVYSQTHEWDTIKRAEASATNRKLKRRDVIKHSENRIENLVEVQQGLITKTIRTSEYIHMKVVNGDKIRDIGKLRFHPNHTYHQTLVEVGEPHIERHFIDDTYASRKGKGQINAALRVKQWLIEDPEGTKWYAQGDVVKFYQNTKHSIIESFLFRIFKDKDYVEALMEPMRRFAPNGVGVPLGTRVSQMLANLVLSVLDWWAKHTMRQKYYIRYMDDFVVLTKTKGEANRFIREASKFLSQYGFSLNPPKMHPVSNGLDYLGYVFYENGDMWWRKRNKTEWLNRRKGVTNKKRLREIDMAAWGMLKWGNKHCKQLFMKVTGMTLEELGLKEQKQSIGKDGQVFFDAPRTSTQVVLDQEITVSGWTKDAKTKHGKNRWVMLLELFGKEYSLIFNSIRMKAFIEMIEEKRVTKFKSKIIDRTGNKHYDFDFDSTIVLEIDNEPVNINEYEEA